MDPNAPDDKVFMPKRRYISDGYFYANSNIMPVQRIFLKKSKRITTSFGLFGLGFDNPMAESIKMYLIKVRRKTEENFVSPAKVFSNKDAKYYIRGSRGGFGMSHRIG